MTGYLLDTHVLLWWISDDDRLGKQTREIIGNGKNAIFISAATTWEISIKRSLGKIQAPENMDAIVDEERFIRLPISLAHGDMAGRLPVIHRDPFDRMLVAQSIFENLILITSDTQIMAYEVRTMKADQ